MVLAERINRVLRIRIHRPEKRNALDAATYQGLQAAIEMAEADPDILVILLCGMPDCFTSGNDLGDFMTFRDSWEDRPGAGFLPALAGTRKPVVAAVSGPALGIGTTLLLHCDLIFASDTARFQLPFINLGLCPEAASTWLLPQRVGYARAAELLMLGESFSAWQALEWGLVNHVVPTAELHDRALSAATQLSEKPAGALVLTKAMLKDQFRQTVSDTLAAERRQFSKQLRSPEFDRAVTAFFNARPVKSPEKQNKESS